MNESAAQRTGGGADRCRRFSGLAEVRVGLGRRSADGGEYHHQNGHPVGPSKNTASARHGPVIVETCCICQARSHLLKKTDPRICYRRSRRFLREVLRPRRSRCMTFKKPICFGAILNKVGCLKENNFGDESCEVRMEAS